MKNKKYTNKKGFTLLEILLVITLIGILASIVLIAINPNRQLAEARNLKRFDDITKINQALEDYFVVNKAYPTGVTQSYQDICPPSGGSNCVDLSALVPDYLPSIPIAPNAAAGTTGYTVAINTKNKQLSLEAKTPELGSTIVINPITPTNILFANQYNLTGGEVSEGVNFYDIKSFADGSSIAAGYIRGTVTLGLDTFTSSGGPVKIIVKYDSNGDIVWVRQPGGYDYDNTEISILSDGSSIVTGSFDGTVTFGTQPALVGTGFDKFIVKYDINGTVVWAKKVSNGGNYKTIQGLSGFADGSSVVTGYFSGTLDFQGQPPLINNNSFSWYTDMFIVKYDTNGNVLWARSAGGYDSSDYGQKATTLTDGSSIVTGSFGTTITFGDQPPLVTVGGSDMYLTKYDTSGNAVWSKQIVSNYYAGINGIKSLTGGGSIITGNFNGTITFGDQPPLESIGETDIFIVKYDTNGNVVWAKQVGATNYNSSLDISVLTDGSSIITGSFGGTVAFGNQPALVSSGENDIFIAKYDTNGNVIWVKSAGAATEPVDTDIGLGITVLSNGDFILIGSVNPFASFDNGLYDLNNSSYVTFMMKYKGT
jgi:prepilin-type N-terminal cleavage/methylation domain-containing protein